MMTFISQIINGFNQSSILLVATMGLVIIFGYMNVTNMAHGSMIMLGGVSAYIISEVLHLPFAVCPLSPLSG